jgi:hypothetical protein
VTGADAAPGMLVKPKLDADAQRAWWKQRVSLTEEKAMPAPDSEGRVTVLSRRMSGDVSVPEMMDDGRNTAVMSVIDDSASAAAMIDASASSGEMPVITGEPTDPSLPRISAEIAAQNPIVDDGKHTMMMDAVDLAALGLDPASSSGSMPAITDEDSGGKKKKKKKR